MKILAGIVTYNPDTERLRQNIKAIAGQVDEIVIYDNGGLDRSLFGQSISIIGDASNKGIAAALNGICEYARQGDFEWVLTLDQDSVCPEGLIDAYTEHTMDCSIGMLCPAITDRGYGTLSYDKGQDETEEVDACITSASMIRLSAWEKVGGFREDFFIDMVDFDICWSLKENGYRIIRLNSKSLLQEIGHSKKVKLFGKEEVVFNHSPLRCYYMTRNTLALGRIHNRSRQCRRWVMKRMLLVNLYEKGSCTKTRMMIRGWRDYRKGISGEYNEHA